MKISPVSIVNYNKIQKNNTVQNNKISNNPNIVSGSLLNNPMAEIIGRSQLLSFKGDNKIDGNMFIHDCFEILGKKENITYNKEDGSFSHSIYNRDGSLIRSEEYFPAQGKEVITTTDLYGTTIKTKTPETRIVEKLNNDGNQVFWEVVYNNGNKNSIVTQYNNNRRIIRETKNGRELQPKVIDLRTGQYVTSGKLVYHRVYDKYTDMYVTENIITGQIIKEEKYGQNKKLQYLSEYNPETNLPVYQKKLNSRTNGYDEYTFYPSGLKKSYTSTSKNGREIDKYNYASDGRTITAHSYTETDKKGDVTFERIYNPATGRIYSETEYDKNIQSVYLFTDRPNVPYSCDKYDNGFKTEHIEFQNDGETYASMTKYNADGTRQENLYSKSGNLLNAEYYSADNYLYKRVEYIEHTGNPKRITENNKYTGEQTKFTFDDLSGELISKKVTYSDGKPKETTEYYPGKNAIPRIKKEYRNDGSYTATFYDTYGNQTTKEEFNADGTRKGYRQQNNWDSSYSGYRTRYSGYTYNYSSTASKQKPPVKDTLDKILSVLANKSGWDCDKISDDEWNVLLDMTGFKTKDDLFSMSKDEYRHLTKKFHPDLNADNPNQKEYEIVFKIISNINSGNKKAS